jgi:hypothetical protein
MSVSEATTILWTDIINMRSYLPSPARSGSPFLQTSGELVQLAPGILISYLISNTIISTKHI